ncbi:hypothetical protein [Paraburkholderia fungorum]|uniref:hypothetical protein n=1 Tax=Paraburkholderia fungorum TaxID=134537 RepID=UPI001C1ED20E|nr:hypothetical protein [Paraburkholderia fungorum]MBU7440250.1 hypothetical protein [Paraburkholderia fungorum]
MGFCIDRYHGDRSFIEAVYDKTKIPKRLDARAICLTGLGGLGKSELINALGRLLASETYVDIGSGHKPILLDPYWSLNFRRQPSLLKTLRELACRTDLPPGRIEVSDLKDQARWRAFTDGTALMAADECQFISFGSSANTKVTNTLISLLYLDLPFVYASNFNLIHLLKKRWQHERDRLLCDPIVMLPELPDSDDWRNFIDECKRVAGSWLKIDAGNDGGQLHNYTFGIRRMLVDLICVSYRLMRERKLKAADMSLIKDAYGSAMYSEHRRDVEQLLTHSPTSDALRDDLRCPFDLQLDHAKQYQDGIRQQKQESSRKIVEAALNTVEKRELDEARASSGATVSDERQERPPRREGAKAEELMKSMGQARSALNRKKIRS